MSGEKRSEIIWTSREVAMTLDLSPDTVNELARRNILPGFKKGRQWRFKKRDVYSYKKDIETRLGASGLESHAMA